MFQTWPRCPRKGTGSYQRLALSQNPSAERLLSPNKLINPRNPPVADGRAARAPVPAQIRQLRASRDPPAAGKGGVGLIQLSLPCAGRGDGIGDRAVGMDLSSLCLPLVWGFGSGQAGSCPGAVPWNTGTPRPPKATSQPTVIPGMSRPPKAPPSLLQHTSEPFSLPSDEQGGGKRGLIPCFYRLVSALFGGWLISDLA